MTKGNGLDVSKFPPFPKIRVLGGSSQILNAIPIESYLFFEVLIKK